MNRWRIYDSKESRFLLIGYDTRPSAERSCKKLNIAPNIDRYKVRDTQSKQNIEKYAHPPIQWSDEDVDRLFGTPKPAVYCSAFCNFGHRLSDGKPIGHECYVIPPALLEKERNGEPWPRAEYWAWRDNRKIHRGLKGDATKGDRK